MQSVMGQQHRYWIGVVSLLPAKSTLRWIPMPSG